MQSLTPKVVHFEHFGHEVSGTLGQPCQCLDRRALELQSFRVVRV